MKSDGERSSKCSLEEKRREEKRGEGSLRRLKRERELDKGVE